MAGLRGPVKVEIKRLHPIFKPGDEATENYIYRCRGWVKKKGREAPIRPRDKKISTEISPRPRKP